MTRIDLSHGEVFVLDGEDFIAGIDPDHGPFLVTPDNKKWVGCDKIRNFALFMVIVARGVSDHDKEHESSILSLIEWLLEIVEEFEEKEKNNEATISKS